MEDTFRDPPSLPADGRDTLESTAARLGCAGSPARVLLQKAGWPADRAEEDLPPTSAWSSPTGAVLVVVALEAEDVIAALGRVSRLRETALAAFGATPREHVTCLFVVGGSFNRQAVDRAVAVRRVGEDVRVITSGALSTVASLVACGTLREAEALTLLRPVGSCADDMVAILDRHTGRPSAQPASGGGSVSCPQCGERGVRTALRPADLGGKLVYLHCRDCGHVWSIEERRASA